jgi:fucose 4-O-acetylase-like acetyltransferase
LKAEIRKIEMAVGKEVVVFNDSSFLGAGQTINPPNDRILWIDFAKVAGIWLVALGHMPIDAYLLIIIYSFHIPLFFFLSGYLEKDKKIWESLIIGVKTLIIPYVILYALNYLWSFPYFLLRNPEFVKEVTIYNVLIEPLLGMLFGEGRNTTISSMINPVLWFLIGLFLVKMIHAVLRRITKNLVVYALGAFIILGIAYVLKRQNIDLLFSVDSALMAFPFFSIGYLLKQKHLLEWLGDTQTKFLLRNIVLVVAGFTLLAIVAPFNGQTDVNSFNYGKNIVLYYIFACIGILSVLLLSSLYKHLNKVITILAGGTIVIMAFHRNIFGLLYRIFGVDTDGSLINPATGGLLALANILLFVIPLIIIKKYFPILTGGRK